MASLYQVLIYGTHASLRYFGSEYTLRNIRKLYLGPIYLVDPGSTRSTQIHLGVLLIHLRVPRLTPGLL